MQLYYERDKPGAVLLPVTRPEGRNPPLQAPEADKIARLLAPLQQGKAVSISLYRYTNRKYLNMRDFSTAELRALLGTAYSPALRRMKSPLSGAQNPFRRETIRFELKPVNQTIKVPPKVPPVNTALPGKSDPTQRLPNAPDSNPAAEDDINKWRKLTYSNDRLEAQQARYRLASYYMQQGDEKQAISLLQQNTASGAPISNWRISSYLLLADFYEKNGDRSQAMYLLERASKESLDPETTREIRSRLQRLQKAPSKKY
jgi:tetratricopeptide (TPR) repeat protein